jgi:hypothetical protein
MGRTPKLNENLGKGHWPYTSVLCYGKIFQGGKKFGGEDEFGRGIPIDPLFGTASGPRPQRLGIENIYAALFQKYNLNYSKIHKNLLPLVCILEK